MRAAAKRAKWFRHTSRILEGAVKACEAIRLKDTSVLVHCSDG
jgi:hypothetical protein